MVQCSSIQKVKVATAANYIFHLHSAAAQGAPQATQCADRFHLLKNLGEALEDLLARHLSASRKRQVEAALEEQTPAWQERPRPGKRHDILGVLARLKRISRPISRTAWLAISR